MNVLTYKLPIVAVSSLVGIFVTESAPLPAITFSGACLSSEQASPHFWGYVQAPNPQTHGLGARRSPFRLHLDGSKLVGALIQMYWNGCFTTCRAS